MKGLIAKILLSLTAVILVAGTLVLDEKLVASASEQELDKIEVIEKGSDSLFKNENGSYIFDSGATQGMSLLIGGNAIIRLAPNSSGELNLSKTFPRNGTLKLKTGRFWINTINSSLNLEIKTARPSLSEATKLMRPKGATFSVAVSAEPGVFDVQYGNETFVLVALRHSLLVNFSGKNLVIPELKQMTISEKKLQQQADVISKLMYSKLLKEFSYFAAEKPDKWITANQEDDKKFFNELAEEKLQLIRESGFKVTSDKDSVFFKLDGILKNAEMTLTFDREKRDRILAKRVLDYFDSAVFAALIGKEDLAKEWLNEFKNQAPGGESFETALQKRLDEFGFINSSDSLFNAKITLQKLAVKDPLNSAHIAFNNVLDIAALGSDTSVLAKVGSSLKDFGSFADKNINRVKGGNAAEEIFFESVRINDFLDRNPKMFLKEEFLRASEIFEKTYLNLVASRAEADDQRQFLISEKLKRVAVLKALMEKEGMPYEDSRAALLFIASQIDSLKPVFSDTAVLAYFDEQLKQLAPLLAFLRANTATNMRGSFQDNFKDFQSRTREMQQIMELLATSTGGAQITAAKREELASVVMNDLGNIGANGIKIVLPENEEDPAVTVSSAFFGNAPFSGIYDTDKKILSGIKFNNEEVANSIRLENLKKFFNVKLGKENLTPGISEKSLTLEPEKQTDLEKIAKVTLISELKKIGIETEEKYVDMKDFENGVIHVELGLIGEGDNEKVFAFDVSDKLTVVSNLKVQTISGEIPVNGKFAIKDISFRVEQIYKKALFDKKKEEELNDKIQNPNDE